MKKLLFVVSCSYIGGVETLVLRLGQALKGKYLIDVCVVDGAGALHPEYLKTFNRVFEYWNFEYRDSIPERFCNVIDGYSYDKIHIFNHFVFSDKIARRFVSKMIQSIHYSPDALTTEHKEILGRRQNEFAGIISDSQLHNYQGLQYIPNFIDFSKYEGRRKDNKILWVGKFNTTKGIDLLYEVIRGLKDRFLLIDGYPNIQGASEFRQKLINDFGERVEIRTQQSEAGMLKAYSECDRLLITSRYEGTPIALLEGMAAGLVPVSTAVGNIPNVITHEKTGFLYETAMQAAVNLVNIPVNMCISCSNEARKYDISVMLEKYIGVYEQ